MEGVWNWVVCKVLSNLPHSVPWFCDMNWNQQPASCSLGQGALMGWAKGRLSYPNPDGQLCDLLKTCDVMLGNVV